MTTRQRTVADLLAEHPETSRLRIGPVVLHMNPDSYEEDAQRVVVTTQTAGGYGRYDYGNRPTRYTIEGSTGLSGVYGPGGVQALRQLEPQAGRPDKLWPLVFPGEFRGVRYVKVTEFHLTRQASSQFFHAYRIVAEEYPKTLLVSARRVPSTLFSTPLPVGG